MISYAASKFVFMYDVMQLKEGCTILIRGNEDDDDDEVGPITEGREEEE